jgi:hypothetical protein
MWEKTSVNVRDGGGINSDLSPALGASAISVLDKQMRSTDLALGDANYCAGTRGGAVVGSHVVLELFGVGA